MFQSYFEDKERGGFYHASSEDWSGIADTDKHAEEQFTAARTSVIGAMLTHDPEVIAEAERAVSDVINRFEDVRNGGYYFAADSDWNIIKREKSLSVTGEIFGVLMHLYEVSRNDRYLQKAMDFMDLALERARDTRFGGFYSLYEEDWKPATDIKDLQTQSSVLQHLNGSWKDGMDSPLGAKAAAHKKEAQAFGALLLDKARDTVHGGFYTAFAPDWTPAVREKDVDQLASLALTLYFHYHNLGPSVWGPRRGSHAYTGRSYPEAYRYFGPAPCIDPIGKEAFRFGKAVMEICYLLIDRAWDPQHGGFYSRLKENLQPHDDSKQISTQIACLMALNVGCRLTGFQRFQSRLAEAVKALEDKAFDPENSGVYTSFSRAWEPKLREKICGPNLMIGGIMSMVAPVAGGQDLTRQTLAMWIDPPVQEIAGGCAGRLRVTVQNQGFETVRVRLGGLTAPGRWMDPADSVLALAPHEVSGCTVSVTPPAGMPPGKYCFEITCMPDGPVGEYVSAGGKIVIT